MTFEKLITILKIENLNSYDHCYLTINCDTGQHSQLLQCLLSKKCISETPKYLCMSYGVEEGNLKLMKVYEIIEKWKQGYENGSKYFALNLLSNLSHLNFSSFHEQVSKSFGIISNSGFS